MTIERPMFPPRASIDTSLKFRHLESAVHDLDRLAEIADQMIGGWLDKTAGNLPREGELAICAVEVLRREITEFKASYLAAFKG
jgi:hypothetical protein